MIAEVTCFRSATPEDVAAIALLCERANAQRSGTPLPEVVQDELAMQELPGRMAQPDAWTRVATNEGQLVGFSLGYPAEHDPTMPNAANAEYVSLLMVEPEYWGRLIGSRLLRLAAGHARNSKRDAVILWTREPDNARAHAFYEHNGYTSTGDTRHKDGELQRQYRLDLTK